MPRPAASRTAPISGLRRHHAFRLRKLWYAPPFGDHRPHRRQRRTVIAAGDGLVLLRDFHRRQPIAPNSIDGNRVDLRFRDTQRCVEA